MSGELISTTDARAMVAAGELRPIVGDTVPDYGGEVIDRGYYEAYVQHVSMAGSGIAMNECMSAAEAIAYRDLTPPPDPVPSSFGGYHDQAWCPQLRVVLSWTNTVSLPLVLEWRVGAGSWTQIATLAAGTTGYVHNEFGSPLQGSNSYRLSYQGKSTYATTSVFVACMT